MENEKKMRVKVETLPNGYALTVDREEYMYYTLNELLAGVFYHVGLQKLDYISVDHVDMLMEAIVSWPSIQEAAQGQAIHMKELKETRRDLYKTRKQLADLDKRLQGEKANFRECNGKLIMAQKRIERDSDLSIRLANALEAMHKLNVRNVKIEKEKHEQAETIAALKRELAKYRKSEAAGGETKTERTVGKVNRTRYVRTRKDADAAVRAELERQQQNNQD